MSATYDTPMDVIAERVLREGAIWDVKTLLTAHAPEDLTACELLAILVILRGAKERLEAQQRPPAPVLELRVRASPVSSRKTGRGRKGRI
jgi:hypothetical protein